MINPSANSAGNDWVDSSWFDKIVHSLRSDQLTLEADVASEETKEFYHTLMHGSLLDATIKTRELTSVELIRKVIYDYAGALQEFKASPLKLAFDFGDSKVMVWAVVKDDDADTEDKLLLAEAKANAINTQFGFHVSSTIMEESDGVDVPPHYKPAIE